MRHVLSILLLAPSLVMAQGTPADYERAEKLPHRTQDKVFRTSVAPHWSADGDRLWYRVDLGGGQSEFVAVDAVRGRRELAFDHAKLAAALAARSKSAVSAQRLPIDDLALDPEGKWVRFRMAGSRLECSLPGYELKEAPAEKVKASLTPLAKPRPSKDSGERAKLVFENDRDEPIELFWIDADGGRKSYGTVPAKRESEISTYVGHVWVVADRKGTTIAVFEAAEGSQRAVVGAKTTIEQPRRAPKASGNSSPDGKWTAVLRDHNLLLRDRASGMETALTRDAKASDGYEGPVFWSPDSSRLVAIRTIPGDGRKVNLIESSPADRQFPKLHTIDYPKPGDKKPNQKPHLFDVAAKTEIAVPDDLFREQWNLSHFRWDGAGAEFRFLFNQRGHQALRLLGIDGKTGAVRPIIDESSTTFIDYAGKFFLEELDDTGEAIWMSERDGWNHLYLIDTATGKVRSAITTGAWCVRGVDRVDAKKRQVWFRAGGLAVDQDPYHVHFCRVDFDGKNLVKLTKGDGTHSVRPSPDGRFLIDTYSRVDLAPVTELRRADNGSLVCVLERGDRSALDATGWQTPERFVAKGRDGVTDIYGVIYRPTNFDASNRYPVIEAIYAGPQGSFVPREFRSLHSPQQLAELGFIVVQIDGMGTSHRSKAFHDVCWKNLGDSGFPDRILWIRAAAAKYPYMDLRKVGIYGGSAGGQSALRALLAFGGFYYAAVADCGCHDNLLDKDWWNELWMGWPIGPEYREQSNVTNAHKLKGNLLLTVGELDRNVDPVSTMQVVDALIKARKDFDVLVVPGAGHGAGGSPYGVRRRNDFFVRHLLGVEPPDRNR